MTSNVGSEAIAELGARSLGLCLARPFAEDASGTYTCMRSKADFMARLIYRAFMCRPLVSKTGSTYQIAYPLLRVCRSFFLSSFELLYSSRGMLLG